MIQSFGDRDTELLFNRERIKKLHSELLQRARSKLLIINAAANESDLNIPPGNRFEKLKGDKKDWCSIRINDQWRVIFKWADGNAREVTITDYH
ncbi:MAG: type II toxin-antitoxin system RelE/ParE family toxin [Treponema sp.]|jgi:proteic killer suppression protein|nr:type II toxin-antitoxin system RelE/ParE family toxin [Treponema sp.]